MDFETAITTLVSKEASDAYGDADRLGDMIERLARALGFTISIAAGGDAKLIDTLIAGAEGYAHSEAVEKSRLAKFMASIPRKAT